MTNRLGFAPHHPIAPPPLRAGPIPACLVRLGLVFLFALVFPAGWGIPLWAAPPSSSDTVATRTLPLVEKQVFRIPDFLFRHARRRLPVEVGYETYGTLAPTRDNVVLVCHYFTGQSHAAGRYAADDPQPGWWDSLIGPGKTIDTDRFFVISVDCLANLNVHNPRVHTTGPATIDPATGRPYAMDFPIFTLEDVIRTQKLLLDHLGIKRLRLVIGPSMGGLQAWMWGRHYPDMVDRLVAVFATPMMRPWCLMMPNQLGIDAIRLDPKWRGGEYYGGEPPLEGLLQAFKVLLMVTRTDAWAERSFGRRLASGTPDPFRSHEGRFLVDSEVENIVRGRMKFFDPNHYLYIAKANTLFDLREGDETFAQALSHITPPSLMIIDESDLMFTRAQAEEALRYLPRGELFCYDSRNGHLSCLYETDYFKDRLREFIDAGQR